MATTLKCTITTLNDNPIKGLTAVVYYKDGDPSDKDNTNSDGKTSIELEAEKKPKHLAIYERDIILKTVSLGGTKPSKEIIELPLKLAPEKLSMLALPKAEGKLWESLNRALLLVLAENMAQQISAAQEKKVDQATFSALKKQLFELLKKEDVSQLAGQRLDTLLKEVQAAASHPAGGKKQRKSRKTEKDNTAPTVGTFLQLEKPVFENTWLTPFFQEKTTDDAARFLFDEDQAQKTNNLKALLEKHQEDSVATLKKEIKENFEKDFVKIELWLDTAPIIGNDATLLKGILQEEEIKTARDLVRIRTTEIAENLNVSWAKLLESKDDFPIAGTKDDYIRLLENRVASRYPYAYMMDRLLVGDFAVKDEEFQGAYKHLFPGVDDKETIKEQLERNKKNKNFLEENPNINLLKVDLLKDLTTDDGKTKKWAWNGRTKGKITDPLQNHLLAMQRVFRLAPSYATAAALLKTGLHTAASVSRLPLYELENRIKNIDDRIPQKSIVKLKARAERRVAQTMDYMANIHSLRSNRRTRTNVDVTISNSANGQQAGPLAAVEQELKKIPGWETHFGKQNYCQCAHCQSIFSPGAYFVDLMQYAKWGMIYLDEAGQEINTPEGKPLHLKKRRSDLWKLPLNCENAHREIPYLAVVNEVLEQYSTSGIAKVLNEWDVKFERGLPITREERQLNKRRSSYANLFLKEGFDEKSILPKDIDIYAVGTTRIDGQFSNLSFSRTKSYYIEKLKLILSHFKLSLFDLFEIQHQEFDKEKARYFLGVSIYQWEVITNKKQEKNLIRYGELIKNDGALLVSQLLNKTGLSRKELTSLLETKFIHQDEVKVVPIELDNEVNRYYQVINNFTPNVADRLFRFVQLWKLLPWSIQELDLALNGITLDSNKLTELSQTLYIQKELGLSVEEAIGVTSSIPTVKGVQVEAHQQAYTGLKFEHPSPSLLHRLFKPFEDDLNLSEQSLTKDINNYFKDFYHPTLDSRPTEDKSGDHSKIPTLQRVLKVSNTDLSFLFNHLMKNNKLRPSEKELSEGIVDIETNDLDIFYRYTTIASNLSLSMRELVGLINLSFDEEKVLTDKDDIIKLIQEHHKIQSLPLSIEDLLYTIQDDFINPIYNLEEQDLKNSWNQFLPELEALKIDSSIFWEIFKEEQDEEVEKYNEVFREIINQLLDKKIAHVYEDAIYLCVKEINTSQISEIIDGLNNITEPVKSTVRNRGEEISNLLSQRPAPFFKFLANFFNITTKNTISGFHFIETNVITSPEIIKNNKRVIRSDFNEIIFFAKDLKKYLLVVEKFGLSDEQSLLLKEAPESFDMNRRQNSQRIEGLYTLNVLHNINEYKNWIDLTLEVSIDIPSFIKNYPAYDENSKEFNLIADSLKISPQQLLKIISKFNLNVSTIENFKFLRQSCQVMSLLGISIDAMMNLSTLNTFNAVKKSNNDLLSAFKSKYKTEADWQEVWGPYEEKLLELKRDILVDYILNWRNRKENRENADGEKYYNFQSINDLYHYFLLDPKMSGCALISKIKAATLSLQLYIQRVQLQLEVSKDNSFLAQMHPDATRQWVWRKNYRIWEANRKVFLYPENYIEPEWRDNKSPQFKYLEEELMQEEINADSVEQAYKLYLNQFVEVANLIPAGHYFDDRDGKDIYYFFGRTAAEPYIYYYRKYIPKTDIRAKEWTAWEKIELPITAEWVSAIHHYGKLYLFWTQTVKKTNENDQATYDYETSVWYSHLKADGRWDREKKFSGVKPIPKLERLGLHHYLALAFLSANFGQYKFNGVMLLGGLSIQLSHPFTNVSTELEIEQNGPFDFDYDWQSPSTETGVKSKIDFQNSEIVPTKLERSATSLELEPLASIDNSRLSISLSQFEKLKNTTFHLPWVEGMNKNKNLPYKITKTLKSRIKSLKIFTNSTSQILRNDRENYLLEFSFNDDHIWFVNSAEEETAANLQPEEWGGSDSLRAIPQNYSTYQQGSDTPSTAPRQVIKNTTQVALNKGLRPVKMLAIPMQTLITETLERSIYERSLKEYLSFKNQSWLAEPPVSIFLPNGENARLQTEIVQPSIKGLHFDGPYGIYFRELFFHIPFLIANHLNANQKFKEAKWWYERIFNPTAAPPAHDRGNHTHFWEYLPFRQVAEQGVSTLKAQLQNTQQIGAYEEEPFMPHMIARSRTDAYMKTIVMKYIDNLLDWGDHLFARDSFESINEAMMLYLLAQDILGDKPVELAPCDQPREAMTYEKLADTLDADDKADDFLIYVENTISEEEQESAGAEQQMIDGQAVDQSPVIDMYTALPYFCVPYNKDMVAYWDRVEDRLFKIRNCQNIRGQKRKLSLYEPPIDPRLLVAARAAGLSLEDAIASVLGGGNLPNYRFNTILSKARDFVSTVQSFGSALLSAVEKKDVEQLTLLRSTHEQNILKLTKQTKKNQIEEARTQLVNLQETRTNVQNRVGYYDTLIEKGLLGVENTQQKSAHIGNIIKVAGAIADGVAAGLHLVYKSPTSTGGDEAAQSADAIARGIHASSSVAHAISGSAGIEAGNQRRKQEWKQQLKLAQQELKQIDQQILAAEIRLAINEQDLVVYEQQVEQAKELHDFYKNKLTKLGLYNYHATTLSRLFRQAYNMALDMAKQAQRCYQFECNDETTYIIQNDNWDSRQYGFLAGERLLFQLQQLDKAYLEKNSRKQEITQSFSLRQLNANALLGLKIDGETGSFTIPEWVFDLFYPGHYRRIIKSVRVTIPCVTGPYTNVPAMLTLSGSSIRPTSSAGPTDVRYGKMQSISTSSGTNDAGLFEFNFRDERYLPFEGAGAINSKWTLSLPKEYHPFDYNTISDVIIHISYTSEIGDTDRPIEIQGTDKPTLLLSLRHDFPNEFHQLIQDENDTAVPLKIDHSYFPYFAMGKKITIESIKAYNKGENPDPSIVNPEILPGGSSTFNIKKGHLFNDKDAFVLIDYSISNE